MTVIYCLHCNDQFQTVFTADDMEVIAPQRLIHFKYIKKRENKPFI